VESSRLILTRTLFTPDGMPRLESEAVPEMTVVATVTEEPLTGQVATELGIIGSIVN